MENVFGFAPRATAKSVLATHCPDCDQRTRMLSFFTAKYGWERVCMRCGRCWCGGVMMPLDYAGASRQASVDAAKGRWRTMPRLPQDLHSLLSVKGGDHSVQNELILIRGLPGSGKSTLAKSLSAYTHYEADMFIERNGVYEYGPMRVEQAHRWCIGKTRTSVNMGRSVVVSNTFVQLWEMQPYFDLGVPVRVVEATGNWKSTHNVPVAVVQQMRDDWEVYSGPGLIDLPTLQRINASAFEGAQRLTG